MTKLTFVLPTQGNWPPVGAEHLHCEALPNGFRIDSIPFFVQDLSAGDVIEVLERDDRGEVLEWKHLDRAANSTVWVMNLAKLPLSQKFQHLRKLGCRIEHFSHFNLSAVDVPTSVPASVIDDCFGEFNEEQVALAFPSWRHSESDA